MLRPKRRERRGRRDPRRSRHLAAVILLPSSCCRPLAPIPAYPICIRLLNQRAANCLTPSRIRPQMHRSPRPAHAALFHRMADQFASRGLRRRRHSLCRAQPVKLSYRLAFLTVARPQKLRQVAALQGAAPRPTKASQRQAFCIRLLSQRAASCLAPSRSRPQLHSSTSPTHTSPWHRFTHQFDSRGLRRRRRVPTPI